MAEAVQPLGHHVTAQLPAPAGGEGLQRASAKVEAWRRPKVALNTRMGDWHYLPAGVNAMLVTKLHTANHTIELNDAEQTAQETVRPFPARVQGPRSACVLRHALAAMPRCASRWRLSSTSEEEMSHCGHCEVGRGRLFCRPCSCWSHCHPGPRGSRGKQCYQGREPDHQGKVPAR